MLRAAFHILFTAFGTPLKILENDNSYHTTDQNSESENDSRKWFNDRCSKSVETTAKWNQRLLKLRRNKTTAGTESTTTPVRVRTTLAMESKPPQ